MQLPLFTISDRPRVHASFRKAALAVSTLAALLGTPAAHAQVAAQSADAFVESIGVGTHWTYNNVYTSQYNDLKTKLGQLGVRYIRDGANAATYTRANDLFATYGIKTNILTGRRTGPYPAPLDPTQLDAELAEIKANVLAASVSIEGPNEYDLSHDASEGDWVGKIKTYQQQLYTKVKADPALRNLTVIGPSFTSEAAYVAVGSLDPYLDHANIHMYQSDRNPGIGGWGDKGYGSISWHFQYLISKQTPSGKPVEATEAGYHNDPSADGLSEEAEGKYMPRTYAEFFRRGVARTYKYELVNEGVAGKESLFGLLRNDLTEKPSFRAVKNLISVLQDPGASFTPAPLAYTLTGASADVRQLLFQKRNGDYYLMLWQEVPSWDPFTNVNLYPAAQNVTVQVPAALTNATLYALNNNGEMTMASPALSGGAMQVSVTDKISILKLSAAASPLTLRTPENPTGTVAGLTYQHYLGQWTSLPDLSTLLPAKTGTVATFDLSPRLRNEQYAFRYTGFVTVPQDGQYTFYTTSDDGSQLYIGNQLVVSNDGVHLSQEQMGTIGLKAGTHALAVVYFQSVGDQTLSVSYQGPGLAKQVIPASALSTLPAPPQPISGTVYRLTPKSAPTKCLEAAAGVPLEGANAQQFEYTGRLNQQWKLISTNDGYYRLVNQSSPAGQEQVLDLDRCIVDNGTNIGVYRWLDNPCQRYRFIPLSDGTYKISPRAAFELGLDRVLDVTSCSPDNNDATNRANVQLYDWLDSPCQHWQLTPLSGALATTAATRPAAGLRVFPNPAADAVTLQYYSATAQPASLIVTNLVGQRVQEKTVQLRQGDNQLELSAHDLKSGLHFVTVRTNGQTATIKLQVIN